MPEISRFYGIVVLMFFGDHPPPHFHARYAEHRAKLALDGSIIESDLPPSALRLLREWIGLHREELRFVLGARRAIRGARVDRATAIIQGTWWT